MNILFVYALAVLLIFNLHFNKVYALENEEQINRSEIIIANKYAEKYCIAKKDNFFEGLENEKTLKYSYFKYMGFQNEKMISQDFYQLIIHQISENCNITDEEEKEIEEFYIENNK